MNLKLKSENWLKIYTRVFGLVFLVFSSLSPSQEAPGFVVGDIRLQGIQRVSAGTVFNILPISVGETMDMLKTREVTRALFASGYFDDIRIARDDDVPVSYTHLTLPTNREV